MPPKGYLIRPCVFGLAHVLTQVAHQGLDSPFHLVHPGPVISMPEAPLAGDAVPVLFDFLHLLRIAPNNKMKMLHPPLLQLDAPDGPQAPPDQPLPESMEKGKGVFRTPVEGQRNEMRNPHQVVSAPQQQAQKALT